MKSLSLLNDDTTVKLGDTGTIIQFRATEDGSPISLKQGQTASFRIKNDIGFLTNVPATTTMNGYVYQLDTSTLSFLVVGTYYVELVINQNNENLIFPDEGFVTFNISANALNITGEQLPVMSLDTFKQELQQYTDNQVTNAEQTIQHNFQNYISNIKDSTIKQAQLAYQFSNNYNLDDLFSGSIPGVPAPVDYNHIPKGIYAGNGWSKGVNKFSDFPSFAINKFFLLEVFNVQNSYVIQRLSLADGTTYEKTIDLSTYKTIIDWMLIGDVSSLFKSFSTKLETLKLTNLNDCPLGVYQVNGWGTDGTITNIPKYQGFGIMIVMPFWAIGGKFQLWLCPDYLAYRSSSDNSSWTAWKKLSETPL